DIDDGLSYRVGEYHRDLELPVMRAEYRRVDAKRNIAQLEVDLVARFPGLDVLRRKLGVRSPVADAAGPVTGAELHIIHGVVIGLPAQADVIKSDVALIAEGLHRDRNLEISAFKKTVMKVDVLAVARKPDAGVEGQPLDEFIGYVGEGAQ